MTLRGKTLLILSIGGALFLSGMGAVASWIINNETRDLERERGMATVGRVRQAFTRELEHLAEKIVEYAAWNDAYQFVGDGNINFIESNLAPPPHQDKRLRSIAYLRDDGSAVGTIRIMGDSPIARRLMPELGRIIPDIYKIVRAREGADVTAGLIKNGDSNWLVAARKVTKSDGSGPPRGYCILSRYLDHSAIADLAATADVPLEAEDASEADLSKKPPGEDHWYDPAHDGSPAGFILLEDMHQRPALLLRARFPRDFASTSSSFLIYLISALAICSVLGISASIVALEIFVLNRLRKISKEVLQIGDRGVASARIHETGGDELCALVESINNMLDQLERAERDARESERKFLVMADTAPVLVRMTDLRGNGTFFNKEWLTFTGRATEAEEGRGWLEAVHPEDARRCLMMEEEASSRRTSISIEYRLRRRDGEYRWLLETRAPRFGNNGDCQGTIGSALDITERKLLERAILDAKETAERAARDKSDFLAKMSHELRTPMNGVIGMLDLGLQTELTGEQQQYLGVARASASHLLQVVNDILDFSKGEGGKLHLENIPLDPRAVAIEAVGAVSPLADKKGLVITQTIDDELPRRLLGDPTRLRQVLINLLSNAVKFTSSGSIILKIERLLGDAQSVQIRFSVKDSGIGIAKEHLSKVFIAFSQADGTIARRFGGTGLGLAICKQLVGLMGGDIIIQSEPGKGSEFSFIIELKVAPAERRSPASSTPPDGSLVPAALPAAKLKILVADDNPVNRLVVDKILTKAGHGAICVESGEAALEVAAAERFDMILMDIQMPGLDGYETTGMIRKREESENRHTPIIALTAQALAGDRERCLSAGMDGYVTKPIQASELLSTIAAFAGTAPSGDRGLTVT